MKKTKTMKTRIIAGVLSAITVFSVGTVATTSASALSAKSIAKDISSFAITQTIDKFLSNSIKGSLLKMGTGYLLDWVFDSKEEKEPTVSDAIEKIEHLRETVQQNHEEEMKSLKVINSNIDTKDFRMEADSIRDDYKNALTEIRRHSNNITMSKEGVIDAKTFGAYRKILASSSCNIPSLEKNFNKMKGYVLGERHSTDKKSAYQTTTDYLYNKVIAGYKETHNWKDSTDFLSIVKKDINGEIDSIHFEAELDYFTMLLLNNMAYKVREYEVQNGIYKPAEGEKPYAYYQNFETDLSKAMGKFNEAYKKVIDANNKDGKMVQAVITLAEPVDGIQVKGFRSFAEAWAQASATNKNFKIELRDNIKSIKDKCFNTDGLDKDKYGFTPGGSFHVKDGRTITVDLGGYTIDNTACPNLSTFGFESNTNLIIHNGTIKGGENGLRADGRTKVHINANKLTVTDTTWAGIYMGVHSIGAYNAKDMRVNLTNCTIKNNKAILVFLTLIVKQRYFHGTVVLSVSGPQITGCSSPACIFNVLISSPDVFLIIIPWQFLNFNPLPQGHSSFERGSLLPLDTVITPAFIMLISAVLSSNSSKAFVSPAHKFISLTKVSAALFIPVIQSSLISE